jgi:hypothetical protein
MPTITLEVEKENDYHKIIEFVGNLEVKIVAQSVVSTVERLDFIEEFYNLFQSDVKGFQFVRKDAHER